MAALTADVLGMFHQGNPDIVALLTTAGTFFKGSLVSFDISNGTVINGVNAALAAGDIFAGVVAVGKTTVAGDLFLEVVIGGIFHFRAGVPAITDVGLDVAMIDLSGNSDNPADILVEAGAAAGDIPIGRLLWSDGDNVIVNTADRFLAIVGA